MYIMFISYGDGTHQTAIHANIEALEEQITTGLSTTVTEEMHKEILSIGYGGEDSYYYEFSQHNGNAAWFSISYFINREVALGLLNEPAPTLCYNKDDLTIEDRKEIFLSVIYGASDITHNLLDSLLSNYSIGGIEIIGENDSLVNIQD